MNPTLRRCQWCNSDMYLDLGNLGFDRCDHCDSTSPCRANCAKCTATERTMDAFVQTIEAGE